MTEYPSFAEMVSRLLRPGEISASARTVQYFGWLLLLEGGGIFVFPAHIMGLLGLHAGATEYFRLVGLLISGLGLLYTVSGRVNAQGFVFASLLDRPIVPLIMLVLWYQSLVPAILAIGFSVQDFGSFLFTVFAWRSERRER